MTRPTGGISLLSLIGIHPAAAAGVFAIDWMLFVAEGGTLGGLWVASIPVGIVLAIAVTLIQHRWSPQDDLGLAAGKGLLVGLVTAIPTALPSAGTLGLGTAGAIQMFRDRTGRSQGED
jgi:hypothetical protein